MLVRDCMTATPRVIGPQDSLRDAFETCRRNHIRHLPVVAPDGKLLGLISSSDILRACPSSLEGDPETYDRILDETHVERAMVKNPITIAATEPLASAVEMFIKHRFGALPVVEGGRLVGILSPIDVLKQVLPMLRKQP
jgi:CBS domain-containing protein